MSAQKRSAVMARIRGKDTQPELLIRRILHALGYRFRLHRRDLPGTPDIVLPGRRKVVFVHRMFLAWPLWMPIRSDAHHSARILGDQDHAQSGEGCECG